MIIVYSRAAGGLFSRKNKVVLSILNPPAGAREMMLRSIPAHNIFFGAAKIASTIKLFYDKRRDCLCFCVFPELRKRVAMNPESACYDIRENKRQEDFTMNTSKKFATMIHTPARALLLLIIAVLLTVSGAAADGSSLRLEATWAPERSQTGNFVNSHIAVYEGPSETPLYTLDTGVYIREEAGR